MGRLTPIAGEKLVRILCNRFGFTMLRQRGSHVTLQRGNVYVTVPLKEVRTGLLGCILRDCGIDREEYQDTI